MLILNFDLWWSLVTSNDLYWSQKVSYTQSQYESNILTSRGFQKHITCLGSVIFQVWPLMTFDDLSRSQMTSDLKNSNRFITSLVSAFQKHIGWKKSKNSLFKSIFMYELHGLKWPSSPKNNSRFLKHILLPFQWYISCQDMKKLIFWCTSFKMASEWLWGLECTV